MILRAPLIVGLCAGLLFASGCRLKGDDNADRPETSHEFPRAHRAVSSVGVENVGSEQTRDDLGEAQLVMQLANIKPGMSVADIGAGEGYYTVRLGQEVGRKGRVLAQDIDDVMIKRLGIRVEQGTARQCFHQAGR